MSPFRAFFGSDAAGARLRLDSAGPRRSSTTPPSGPITTPPGGPIIGLPEPAVTSVTASATCTSKGTVTANVEATVKDQGAAIANLKTIAWQIIRTMGAPSNSVPRGRSAVADGGAVYRQAETLAPGESWKGHMTIVGITIIYHQEGQYCARQWTSSGRAPILYNGVPELNAEEQRYPHDRGRSVLQAGAMMNYSAGVSGCTGLRLVPGILPAFDAFLVPLHVGVAVEDGALGGVPAAPAIGMAEHHQRLRLVAAGQPLSQSRYQSSIARRSSPAPAPGSHALPGSVRCGGGTHASAAMLSGLCGIGPTSTSTGSRSAISAASAAVSITRAAFDGRRHRPAHRPGPEPSGSGAVSRSGVAAQAQSRSADMQERFPLPQAGGGLGWGLFYPAKNEFSGTASPPP